MSVNREWGRIYINEINIPCAVLDSDGKNCPNHPLRILEQKDGGILFLCQACYENVLDGAYGDIDLVDIEKE